MNSQEIEWRDIPGYEGYYQISSDGQVKSLLKKTNYVLGYKPGRDETGRWKFTNEIPERIMKPDKAGYIRLSTPKRLMKFVRASKIMAEVFG